MGRTKGRRSAKAPVFRAIRKSDGAVVYEAPLRESVCAEESCRAKFFVGGPYCPRHCRQRMGLEVRRSDNVDGDGVFATRDFAPYEKVSDYCCEQVTKRELVKRYGPLRDGTLHAYTLDEGAKNKKGVRIYADASLDRCVASMLNDAVGFGEANCIFKDNEGYDEPASSIVGIYTTRRIEAGEELLVDYGQEYWDAYKRLAYEYTTTSSKGDLE